MNQIFTGAIAMGLLAVALFFLRFRRLTGDRLFLYFALSFLLMAVNRVALDPLIAGAGTNGLLYWIRLLTFLLILVGIVDKNRSGQSHSGQSDSRPNATSS